MTGLHMEDSSEGRQQVLVDLPVRAATNVEFL